MEKNINITCKIYALLVAVLLTVYFAIFVSVFTRSNSFADETTVQWSTDSCSWRGWDIVK